jgi:AcrR family transcriptional regulator
MPPKKKTPTSKRSGNGSLGHPRGKVPTEQRLDEIFEVAAAQFQAQGFGATRVDDIADALGVTRAALYYYFKSKDELVEFVCSHNMELAESALRAAQEEAGSVERLRAFAQRYTPVLVADAAIVTFRERGELRPAFRRRLMARAQVVTNGVEELVQDCIDDRSFRTDLNPGLATCALLGMLGWCSQWFRHSEYALDDVVTTFFEIFMTGVQTTGDETASPSTVGLASSSG